MLSCSLKKTIFAKNSNHGLQENFKEIQQQIYHRNIDFYDSDNLRRSIQSVLSDKEFQQTQESQKTSRVLRKGNQGAARDTRKTLPRLSPYGTHSTREIHDETRQRSDLYY